MRNTSKARSASRKKQWAVSEAKARFSALIDSALEAGPQTITRNGKKAVVVVSAEEWERKTKPRGTLADFLASSPLRGAGLNVERLPGGLRGVDL